MNKIEKSRGLIKLQVVITIVIAIIIMLSNIVTLTVSYRGSLKLLNKSVQYALNSDADRMNAIVEQWDSHSWGVVDAIMASPAVHEALKGGSLEEATNELTTIFNSNIDLGGYPLYANTVILDKNYIVIATGKKAKPTDEAGEGVGLKAMETPYIQNIEEAKKGNRWVSDVVGSPITGKLEVWYSAPIFENDELIGVAVVPVHTQGLTKYLHSNEDEISNIIFAIDKAGNITSSTDEKKINVNYAQTRLPELGTIKEGEVFEYTGEDNKIKLGVYHENTEVGWKIFSVIDKKTFINDNPLIASYVSAGVMLICVSVIVYVMSSRIKSKE